jgi:glycolate oxidase subunit GlcD
MLTDQHKHFLETLFPGDQSIFSPEEMLAYASDASRLQFMPDAVVRPRTTQQVSELLRWAQDEGVPVHPRGRGTGVVGASLAEAGGVVVSTLLMDQVLEVDPDDFLSRVQPGVVTGELQARLAKHGLLYPPDPASASISTIGGNVATNAGGMRAVKYGVTRDFVLGLTAVLPGGKVLQTGGRNHKNVVGLDLAGLFTGSAGCLGLITEITLKLIPLPQASASVLAVYDSLGEALAAVDRGLKAGVLPVAMELMSETTLLALERAGDAPWPRSASAALLVKLDGCEPAVQHELEVMRRALSPAALLQTGRGPEEEDPLWEARRLINPASYRIAPDKIADDVAVPRSRLRQAIEGYEAAGREAGLAVLCFGHVGDGNVHVNVMHHAGDVNERRRALRARERILELTLELGGTFSGEHGSGISKRHLLPRQLDEDERRLMAGVKRVFDPENILNPGKEPF